MIKSKQVHIGRNVFLIRELRGIKQETLATELGISQQSVSKIENSENVDEEKLEKIATILGVSKELLKSFNQDTAINIFSNTLNENAAINAYPTFHFNPIEKIVELTEQNRELYERLIKEKDAVIDSLRKSAK